LKTAVSGYYWFQKLSPQDAVDLSFYTPGEDKVADRQVVDAALPWLQGGSARLVLIHIDQVDYAGHHEGGPIDPRWDAAAGRADDLLREIAAPLDLTKDVLFVCSDHGQIDRGGHGGQDPITLVEPFVLVGAGIKPGLYPDVQMVDVAPTLAALLGTAIPASSQGTPLASMLSLPPERLAALQSSVASQQRLLLTAYTAAIGSKAALQSGDGSVATTQAAMNQALETRLNRERWPRFVLALLVALVPLAFWLRKGENGWPRTRLWLLGSALLYIFIFNFRYVVLSHLTYSLSSVTSATELILYTAANVAIALLVSWLVLVFSRRAFYTSPPAIAELVLDLAFTVIYLLMLPVLFSFGLNGPLVTWALPDFASTFLAFLSLVQVLVVAVLGLLLCGVSAAIAALLHSTALPR
jgi:hypothetical protein